MEQACGFLFVCLFLVKFNVLGNVIPDVSIFSMCFPFLKFSCLNVCSSRVCTCTFGMIEVENLL